MAETWVWVGLALALGLVIGAAGGVVVMACCVVSGRADGCTMHGEDL